MRVLKADDEAALGAAVDVLNEGGIVAYPTETFYALGARFDNKGALERLFVLKGRAAEKAASLIIGDVGGLDTLVDEAAVTPLARMLMERHWPGPLTLVLKAREGLPPFLTTSGTVAVRVPGDSFASRLARATGFPITATSANPAGEPPPETAEDVLRYFEGKVDLLIDDGRTPGGLPSTIVDATGSQPRVVRRGAVEISDLRSEI